MNTVNINNQEFVIEIGSIDDFKVTFNNQDNQLTQQILKHLGNDKVVRCEQILIKPVSRSIVTTWAAYEKTSTGDLINRREFSPYETTPSDYELFFNAMGIPIKKYAINGLFRMLGNTYAVYDQNLYVIPDENQPIAFPEPETNE